MSKTQMGKFLLDTTSLIDFSKGREPAKSKILEMIESSEVGVCAINVAEFYTGLPLEKRKAWEEFFNSLLYWNINLETAKLAGCFRSNFAKKGQPLTTTDTLVAATAKQEEATLVTSNIKDYPMKEVVLLQINTSD